MEQATKEKLGKIVELVNNAMVDPDIDVDYYIPGVEVTLKEGDSSGDPYILLTYAVSEYTRPTRTIHLGSTMLQSTAEEVANQVTFSIEEFKGEIDSVEMG
jgi:hypothetical protein